jgi:hypothetical protein
MPCVQKWHQESGNSGKPEYLEGHIFGIVSMLSTSGERMRSIPVMAEIHERRAKTSGEGIVEKMAHMRGKTAQSAGKGTLGFYFPFERFGLKAEFLRRRYQTEHICTHSIIGFTQFPGLPNIYMRIIMGGDHSKAYGSTVVFVMLLKIFY